MADWNRNWLTISVDDDTRSITIKTDDGKTVTLSDKNGSISCSDAHGNSFSIGPQGISIKSSRDIVLSTPQNLKLNGGAAAELTSSGLTTVAGPMVKIN